MKAGPRVSVIIPVYNRSRSARRAVASVFAQTFKDFEVIVVDDGSTDDIAGALADWRTKLRLIRLKRNQGPASARNAGLAAARGELAAFLDSDDVWHRPKLERQLIHFRNPAVVCAHSDVNLVDESGRLLHRKLRTDMRPYNKGSVPWRGHETVVISTAVVRRRAAMTVGFDPGFVAAYAEDADFFVRLQLACGRGSLRFDARPLIDLEWSRLTKEGSSREIERRLDLLHWHMKNERGVYG
ncbi:MAG: glycosyltransferase family 2 protein [Elusimicrobiota bacterium]